MNKVCNKYDEWQGNKNIDWETHILVDKLFMIARNMPFYSFILPWTQVIKIAGDVAYVARIVVNAGGCWQVQGPKEKIVVGIVVVNVVFIPPSFFSFNST